MLTTTHWFSKFVAQNSAFFRVFLFIVLQNKMCLSSSLRSRQCLRLEQATCIVSWQLERTSRRSRGVVDHEATKSMMRSDVARRALRSRGFNSKQSWEFSTHCVAHFLQSRFYYSYQGRLCNYNARKRLSALIRGCWRNGDRNISIDENKDDVWTGAVNCFRNQYMAFGFF